MAFIGGLASAGLFAAQASAHCDSMDGPVVKDARRALAGRDVTPVMKWVPKEDEGAVREAFALSLAVRGESEAAQRLADRFFFETLVRLHRAAEGEGFTGIKPAGAVDPAIAAADAALADGKVDALAGKMASEVRRGIEERFADALGKRQSAEASIEEGRAFVRSYVQYTHFVESAARLAAEGASHKHRESQAESR